MQASALVSTVALFFGLAAGTANASIPDAPPTPDQVRTVHVPATPSLSLEPSAELPAAKQREMASRFLRGASAAAEPTAAAPVPQRSADALGEGSGVPVPPMGPRTVEAEPPPAALEIPAGDAGEIQASATPALAHPRPPESGEVSNRSGGTRPERRSASDRGTSAAPASFRDRPAGTADTSSATHVPGDNSTSNFPRDRAPVPPNDPGGAVSAAFGSTSSLLLGGFVAALMGLMLRHAFRAPTRRAASPSASLTPAPFASLLERPG